MVRSLLISVVLSLSVLATTPVASAQGSPTNFVNKLGIDQDVRSGMKVVMDEILAGTVLLPDLPASATHLDTVPQIQLRGNNVQANFPSGDYVQIFPGFRPFVRATQSEVSTAAFGKNIVLGYNNSAGIHVIPNPAGPGLIVDRVQISGFATSNDGGNAFAFLRWYSSTARAIWSPRK